MTPLLGVSKLDLLPSVFDHALLDSSTLLHSFACLGFVLLVLELASISFSFLVQSFARLGSSMFIGGVAQIRSLRALSVVEISNLGSSLSVRSYV